MSNDWKPWFKALAERIAEMKPTEFVEKVRSDNLDWGQSRRGLLKYRDEDIDPFSFIAYVACRNSNPGRRIFYDSVGKLFEIDPELLPNLECDELFDFAKPQKELNMFFFNARKRKQEEAELVWSIFREVVNSTNGKIEPDRVKHMLEIEDVWLQKFVHTLYLIRPDWFHKLK